MSETGNISTLVEHIVLGESGGRGGTNKYVSKYNKCYGKKIKQPREDGDARDGGSLLQIGWWSVKLSL